MAWSVDADPVDFDEAIAWFKKRVAVSKADYERLTAVAKRKAFTVAGVAQLDLVHSVWSAVDDAVKKGTTLEDFKASIGPQLKAAWAGTVDNPAWRLETIFRTNVQSAYCTGRYEQATHPDILGDRPYWMFDAILDGRTTSICSACNGTQRPANDEWWQSHLPPLHHNCRSHFMTLSVSQSTKFGGITLSPPAAEADDGFGLRPSQDEFAPTAAKYPPALFSVFTAKQNVNPPPPPPPASMTLGVHVLDVTIKKGASKADVAPILASITDATILDLLAKLPLRELSLARIAGHNALGWYAYGTDSAAGELRIGMLRPSYTYGKPLVPGSTFSMSNTALDEAGARRATLIHELGHHVHLSKGPPAIDAFVVQAYAAARKNKTFITQYSQVNKDEYFAECFAAYHLNRAQLRGYDPGGLKMVEDVMRERGVTP